ncbi:MAG: 3-oxoacyl-ACP reductase FabG [Acidobacteria bacterium]|nr:3-oxoacyl-ACP reductase FabG [Acidobacteriota bacterium]
MSVERELAGAVALVTGSARNIGRAIAIALADAGAAVMVTGRQALADAEAVAAEIDRAGGRAAAMTADVGDPAAAAALVAATVDRLGRLDILVNNASVRREVDFTDLDYAEWRAVLASTLDAAYLCSRAALPHLTASGRGAIVNIGGLSSHTGAPRRAHVIAAKAGLVGLTRALAHELAPRGVTVNCVAPGLVDTARTGPEPAHHQKLSSPMGRKGRPEEIAALVRFLCGPDARYITGQTIHASGGLYMG